MVCLIDFYLFVYLSVFKIFVSEVTKKKRHADEADVRRIGTSRKNQESVDVLESR
jgi:hypothetical protein